MQRIGVLGVGAMGAPLARRLAGAFEAGAFDVDADRLARMPEHGVAATASALALAAWSDVLVAVLPGAAEARAAFVDGDLMDALRPGALLLDLTSGAPDLSTAIAARAAAHGVGYVAAPMGGGPADAVAGTLRFFVAGPAADVERAVPVLRVLGSTTVIAEDPAAAQTVKLLVNALWFGQAALVAEAMLLGTAAGIDAGALQRLLAQSAAGSVFVDEHLPRLLAGDYLESFGLDRVVEELDSVVAAADAAGAPSELLTHVRALHGAALAAFGPAKGELLVVRLLEERAGRLLRAE